MGDLANDDERDCDNASFCLRRTFAADKAEAALAVLTEQRGAVLALHVDDGAGECVACRADCMYCEGEHAYPCPTRRIFEPE